MAAKESRLPLLLRHLVARVGLIDHIHPGVEVGVLTDALVGARQLVGDRRPLIEIAGLFNRLPFDCKGFLQLIVGRAPPLRHVFGVLPLSCARNHPLGPVRK